MFLVAVLMMMYFSGARFIHLIGLCSGMLGVTLFSLGGHSHGLARLLVFLNPYKDPNGMGYTTMTLGLAPTVGVGMPFVSYGGLSMVVYFIVIGLISSIYKRRDIGIV